MKSKVGKDVSPLARELVDLYCTGIGSKPDAAGATYRSAERIVKQGALKAAALKASIKHYVEECNDILTDPQYRLRPWNFFGAKGGGKSWMDYVEKPKRRSQKKLPDPNGVIPHKRTPAEQMNETERNGAWVMERLGIVYGLIERALVEQHTLDPVMVKRYAQAIGAARNLLMAKVPKRVDPDDIKPPKDWIPDPIWIDAATKQALTNYQTMKPKDA